MAQNPDDTPMSAAAMEAWFQLMAQAMQGTGKAQQAFANLSQSPEAQAGFQQWLALFAPGMEMPFPVSQPEAMTEWLDSWQKAMGVVPRVRYLELLEKTDALERRIRELEEINRQLRAMLEGREQQEESAQKLTELWGQMVETSIETQTTWMEAWTDVESLGGTATAAESLDEEE
jgi:hypothetical protein